MGAKRVTPEEVVRMIDLYRQYGTYAQVAKIVGRSADTVARYVKGKGVRNTQKMALENSVMGYRR